MAKSAERAKKRSVGDPFQEGVEQGPQVDRDQLEKILGYIQVGLGRGPSARDTRGGVEAKAGAGALLLLRLQCVMGATRAPPFLPPAGGP